MNALDLFTGIGGITIGLRKWVRPIAYCEIDPYCQSVLLQRMQEGNLPEAPIWDDVRSLKLGSFRECIDIIYGGFPCQDISVAGRGKGLEGERSGLFFEIVRLCSEIKPRFIFLENVPAITSRGGTEVVREITKMGYDCRWCVISAAGVGALHRRERWFLLANSKHYGSLTCPKRKSFGESFASREQHKQEKSVGETKRASGISSNVAKSSNAYGEPRKQTDTQAFTFSANKDSRGRSTGYYWPFESELHWKEIVSSICRGTDGLPNGVDRLKSLGNAVVPIQVTRAFEILIGL